MTVVLSIIVPTYRRGESLLQLIDAVNKQTLSGIELIIVDQNSPNYLQEIIPAEVFKTFNYYHLQEPNASTARNFGFSRSCGKHVLFLDDDLLPEPDFCQRAMTTLESHLEVQCLWPLVYSVTGKQERLSAMKLLHTGYQIPGTSIYEISEARSDAVFFERETYLQSGGFDEVLFGYTRTAEDQEFFVRMRKRGTRIWLDESLFIFHDETRPGGCDLRTEEYWQVRERCVKAWAFRYRIHGNRNGRLSCSDFYQLCRSSFFNSSLLKSHIGHSIKEIALLVKAIRDSRLYLKPHMMDYVDIKNIDHISKYF